MDKKKNRAIFWIIILTALVASLLVLNWDDLVSGFRDGMKDSY